MSYLLVYQWQQRAMDVAHGYGSRRLQKVLPHQSFTIGRYWARTLMKRHGLRVRWK